MKPTRIITGDLTVLEAGRAARAANMHLICNGKEVRVSPIVPPGWFKVGVKFKPQNDKKAA